MHEVSRCGDNGRHNIHCYLPTVHGHRLRCPEPERRPVETTGAGVSGVTPGVVTVTTSPRPRVETSYDCDKHDEEHLKLTEVDMKDGVYRWPPGWAGWWPGWGWRWWASPPSSSPCRGRWRTRVSSPGRGGGRGITWAMTSLSTSPQTTSTPRWSETNLQDRVSFLAKNISWSDQHQQEPRVFCLLSVPDFLNNVLGPRSYRRLVQFELDWGLAETEKTNVDIGLSQTLPISWFYFFENKIFDEQILNQISHKTISRERVIKASVKSLT